MTYQVLVRESAEKGYTAQVPALPSLEVSAPTVAEAVARAKAAIADELRGAQVVEVDVPSDPWASLAGLYESDPQFEDVLQSIAECREALTAEDLARWDTISAADDAP